MDGTREDNDGVQYGNATCSHCVMAKVGEIYMKVRLLPKNNALWSGGGENVRWRLFLD